MGLLVSSEQIQCGADLSVPGLYWRAGRGWLRPNVKTQGHLLKMHFFRDCGVSAVLESSCMTYTLRFCARCFLALTKTLLFLEVPSNTTMIGVADGARTLPK